MTQGLFITVEGIDGSGKSTFVRALKEALTRDSVLTHAPGATAVGQKIRSILLSKEYQLSSYAELFLFLADRSVLVEEVIRPNLEKGVVVICDRYNDSTAAYQHTTNAPVEELCRLASYDLHPDITFYLDVPIDVAQQRIAHKSPDRIEAEGVNRQKSVLEAYRKLAKEQERIITLDATSSVEDLVTTALNHLEKYELFT